ncbi:MAG: HDOD domain-containing protein [Chitinophagaceae bacterium]|nr:HDOD domain-containing protein [Rubrivivax sp.]
MPPAAAFITVPPANLAGWVACFEDTQLPVLTSTARAMEDLRVVEDDVDAHLLAESMGHDPLMTLKLLAHVARLRRGREGSEPETVTEALVMLGIPPFFRAFGAQVTVDDHLAGRPQAIDGFAAVLRRSSRAANFAIGFAVHRMDHDAAVLHEAALLHDFADLLLWLRAPDLALVVQRRQQADPRLRSATAQREVLNVELGDLQHALMQAWCLPSLLVQITDDHAQRPSAQVRNVQLAIRVARHSALGWDNPALPDDLAEIGELLQLGPDPTTRLLMEIDAA